MSRQARLNEILDRYENDGSGNFTSIRDWFRYAESAAPDVPELNDAQIEDILDNGGEGQGDHAEVVRRITYADGHVELLRMTGYYASYYGFEWDWDIHLCIPQEITTTIYEKA